MPTLNHPRTLSPGFTLTEMAIVLVIVALLLGGLLIPLGAQQDMRAEKETKARLEEVKDALLGYAAANGKLPCPATTASMGQELPTNGGTCTTKTGSGAYGYLPAATLGLPAVNSQGLILDGWNQAIRYAIVSKTINGQTELFTTVNGMKTATLSSIASYISSNALFSVCSTSTGITGAGTTSSACASSAKLTDSAVAVIWSTGKNTDTTGGNGSDESHNPNPSASSVAHDTVFVYHESAPSTATNGEFDDHVTWIATNLLFNRMLTAGQLP